MRCCLVAQELELRRRRCESVVSTGRLEFVKVQLWEIFGPLSVVPVEGSLDHSGEFVGLLEVRLAVFAVLSLRLLEMESDVQSWTVVVYLLER
jgi:hypothetical protein